MTIYGVWNCLTCSIDYYKTKVSAQQKAKEYLVDCIAEFNLTEEQVSEAYDHFYKEDSAYYLYMPKGSCVEGKIDLVSVDEIEVLD